MKMRKLLADQFCWANYKPEKKNWLVLEPADVLILETDKIKLHHLSIVLLKLLFQGTVHSPQYLTKIVALTIKALFEHLRLKIIYLKHSISRLKNSDDERSCAEET